MNILSASNPQWADAAHTAINLSLDIEGIGLVPFTASPDDVEPHGRDLFAAAIAGNFGAVAAKPAPTQAEVDKAASDQAKRDLAALDLDSIRDIRAWVAAQPNAPAMLVTREQNAVTLRGKVLP